MRGQSVDAVIQGDPRSRRLERANGAGSDRARTPAMNVGGACVSDGLRSVRRRLSSVRADSKKDGSMAGSPWGVLLIGAYWGRMCPQHRLGSQRGVLLIGALVLGPDLPSPPGRDRDQGF